MSRCESVAAALSTHLIEDDACEKVKDVCKAYLGKFESMVLAALDSVESSHVSGLKAFSKKYEKVMTACENYSVEAMRPFASMLNVVDEQLGKLNDVMSEMASDLLAQNNFTSRRSSDQRVRGMMQKPKS
ncbi:unnamed protein product [Durusdinium trenchii]|uniref:Uncharacterized protein n=2 Tax=Durusdinium trenchii TaxID=1381693 RepID=A0ABP0PL96_9DINO